MKTAAQRKAEQRARARQAGLCGVCCINPSGAAFTCPACSQQAATRVLSGRPKGDRKAKYQPGDLVRWVVPHRRCGGLHPRAYHVDDRGLVEIVQSAPSEYRGKIIAIHYGIRWPGGAFISWSVPESQLRRANIPLGEVSREPEPGK